MVQNWVAPADSRRPLVRSSTSGRLRISGVTPRIRLFVAAGVTAFGLIAAWRLLILPSRPPLRPNILLVTLDTTRADHLAAYGNAAARTPTFDRLASEGVLFERAVSVAPITLPAHVS